METYIGWGLVLPLVLYILRGYIWHRTMEVLDCSQSCTLVKRYLGILPELFLFCLWCTVNIHLTVIYATAYGCRIYLWCRKRSEWSKAFFMVSLEQPLFTALHMILIGLFSIIIKMPMGLLLNQPIWRILITSFTILGNILWNIVILRYPKLQEALRVLAVSEEKRPFMIFLWLCNIFLLLDSMLCTARILWKMMPMLLIGAAFLKEFYIIRCLFHLNSIIKERHIEKQYRRLEQKLKCQERRTEELKNRSIRDALTGLYSRQYLIEQMEKLLKRKQCFSLAYIDLDGLKYINDSQGHAAGDRYLIRFSQYISGYLREIDFFARIGGDEFVILFLDCDEEDAKDKLEKIRTELSEGQSDSLPSFSFGIAKADAQKSVFQLLERADKIMYQDKERRRH